MAGGLKIRDTKNTHAGDFLQYQISLKIAIKSSESFIFEEFSCTISCLSIKQFHRNCLTVIVIYFT